MKTLLACLIAITAACGGKSNPPPSNGTGGTTEPPASTAECKPGGCSGTVCSDQEGLMTTCEFKPEYACYGSATCARQSDGQCGWTQTPELTACLASPPPMQ